MKYVYFKLHFIYPCGKADATPSSLLPRVRGRRLQLRPWTPRSWGTLDFRSFKVLVFCMLCKRKPLIEGVDLCLLQAVDFIQVSLHNVTETRIVKTMEAEI